MAEHCTQVRVRYADTDQSGVVYHANYIRWFEVARAESMRAHGLPYVEVEAQGIHLPVVDLHVRYHRPALYDQLVEVWAHIAEVSRVQVRYAYRLTLPGESRPLATGHTVHAFVDSAGRVARMDRHPEIWARIQAVAARLSLDGS